MLAHGKRVNHGRGELHLRGALRVRTLACVYVCMLCSLVQAFLNARVCIENCQVLHSYSCRHPLPYHLAVALLAIANVLSVVTYLWRYAIVLLWSTTFFRTQDMFTEHMVDGCTVPSNASAAAAQIVVPFFFHELSPWSRKVPCKAGHVSCDSSRFH